VILWGLEWHSLDSYFQMKEITAPGTPESNQLRLYAKDSSGVARLFYKDDAGVEWGPLGSSAIDGSGAAGRVALWSDTDTLTSDADLTFSTDTLTATKIIAPTSLTISAMTLGSVLFAGTAGILSQDNANFFWDNTNKWLGLGQAIPDFRLSIRGATNADANFVVRETSADTVSPGVAFLKARGTIGSEAATNADDTLGSIGFGGWTNAEKFNAARIEARATTLWTASNSDSHLIIQTTPTGSTTRVERWRVTQAGELSGRTSGGCIVIGGTAAADTLALKANSHADGGKLSINSITIGSGSDIGAAVEVAPTFTGAATGMRGFRAQPTFQPTAATLNAGVAFIGNAIGDPASGKTIGLLAGMIPFYTTGSNSGAITQAASAYLLAPTIGSVKPASSYGLFVENHGAASITNAVGIQINTQANATNNYDMSFQRVDTTAAGAYYGRVPVLYNGLTKYLHVFSA